MAFDLAILGDPENTVSALAVDNTANDGIYKLVQRIMILLLTDIEAPNSNGFGTNLPGIVFSANISNPEVLQGSFDIAQSAVLTQIRETTDPDAPEDEQLEGLSSELVRLDRDEILMNLTVIAVSGDLTTVSAPISNIFVVGD